MSVIETHTQEAEKGQLEQTIAAGVTKIISFINDLPLNTARSFSLNGADISVEKIAFEGRRSATDIETGNTKSRAYQGYQIIFQQGTRQIVVTYHPQVRIPIGVSTHEKHQNQDFPETIDISGLKIPGVTESPDSSYNANNCSHLDGKMITVLKMIEAYKAYENHENPHKGGMVELAMFQIQERVRNQIWPVRNSH